MLMETHLNSLTAMEIPNSRLKLRQNILASQYATFSMLVVCCSQLFIIQQLLEVEDLCDSKPDERSVMTYIASFFHAFSSMGMLAY